MSGMIPPSRQKIVGRQGGWCAGQPETGLPCTRGPPHAMSRGGLVPGHPPTTVLGPLSYLGCPASLLYPQTHSSPVYPAVERAK